MARLCTFICLLTAFALALAACTRPEPVVAAGAHDCQLIAVSSNGWHANIYLPADAFPAGGAMRSTFPEARWLSIGWGDAEAYVTGVNLANSFTAIVWPTPTVLHVAALQRDPREAYLSEYRDVVLSGDGLARLVAALEAELALDAAGAPQIVADGLDPRGSAFLAARSRYHAFNTCNVWTAARLREAGLDVGWTGGHLLPASLLNRLERTALSTCPSSGEEVR